MKRSASSSLRFAATVMFCAAVLGVQARDLLLTPKFVLEDGKIFFAQAHNLAPLDAILTPYAGYWHLVPRLVAEAATALPLTAAPLFLAVCALLTSSVAISWFALPHYRAIVQNDGLRIAFVVLIVFLPGLDGPLLIAYTQWYLALWGMLLIFMTPPQRSAVQWALALVYVAALATAPALFVLWPLWVWRYLRAHERGQKRWIGMIIGATLVILLLTVAGRVVTPMATLTDASMTAMAWDMLVTDMAHAVAFRVLVLPVLGYVLANEIVLVWGWLPIYGLAAAMAVFLLWGTLAPANRSKRAVCLALLYAGISTVCLYFARAPLYNYPFVTTAEGVPFTALRYFFLAIAAALLIMLITIDRWVAQERIGLSAIALGVAVVLLHYSPSYPVAAWWNPNWPQYAWLLNNIIDQDAPASVSWSAQYPQPPAAPAADEDLGQLGVRIPIAPQGWNMVLNLPPHGAQGYIFPEGLRLLGVASEQEEDGLVVTVYWQTVPAAQDVADQAVGSPAGEATAYVHLLDSYGERITGTDVSVAPSQVNTLRDAVWSTQHLLELPGQTAPGLHDVAVGLYWLAEGQVLPGSAVILRDAAEIR